MRKKVIYEKLDFYTMEPNDEEFDVENNRRLLKSSAELKSWSLLAKIVVKALKDFWKYHAER